MGRASRRFLEHNCLLLLIKKNVGYLKREYSSVEEHESFSKSDCFPEKKKN